MESLVSLVRIHMSERRRRAQLQYVQYIQYIKKTTSYKDGDGDRAIISHLAFGPGDLLTITKYLCLNLSMDI
jgi:hypothetical protein